MNARRRYATLAGVSILGGAYGAAASPVGTPALDRMLRRRLPPAVEGPLRFLFDRHEPAPHLASPALVILDDLDLCSGMWQAWKNLATPGGGASAQDAEAIRRGN